jgi:nitrite reductase/ring-hydroxylating ferredoxin subunit
MTEDELEEAGYQAVCSTDEVGYPMPKLVEVNGRGVLICREDDSYFAVDEICPHENQSMKFGVVFDGEITCPHHQYRFKLDDGRCNRRRCAPVQTYPCEVVDGTVWVRVGG